MNLLELLIKGAGHKYIKRIPVGTTKTGKVRYRYIYKTTHTVGGKHLLDEAHLKAGTKLMLHSKDGAEVHAHIESVKGDQVTFTYDDGDRKGETRTVSKQKLLAEFNKENKVGEQIDSAKAELLSNIKAAADSGTSKKQLARLVARLERLGGKVDSTEVYGSDISPADLAIYRQTADKKRAALKDLTDQEVTRLLDQYEAMRYNRGKDIDKDKLEIAARDKSTAALTAERETSHPITAEERAAYDKAKEAYILAQKEQQDLIDSRKKRFKVADPALLNSSVELALLAEMRERKFKKDKAEERRVKGSPLQQEYELYANARAKMDAMHNAPDRRGFTTSDFGEFTSLPESYNLKDALEIVEQGATKDPALALIAERRIQEHELNEDKLSELQVRGGSSQELKYIRNDRRRNIRELNFALGELKNNEQRTAFYMDNSISEASSLFPYQDTTTKAGKRTAASKKDQSAMIGKLKGIIESRYTSTGKTALDAAKDKTRAAMEQHIATIESNSGSSEDHKTKRAEAIKKLGEVARGKHFD